MSIGTITFSEAYPVAHILHTLNWRDRAPDEAIALMAETIRGNRMALVLNCPERPNHTQALGLVMPTKEEDMGVLLMHVWGKGPFSSELLRVTVLITADDGVCALTGESISQEHIVFAPEVKKALTSWRLRRP